MTMEVSGLPPAEADSFDTLKAARDAYKEFFGSDLPGTSYDFYDPPVPVEIGGSLFFDMSHASGSRPGPQSLRDEPVIRLVGGASPHKGVRNDQYRDNSYGHASSFSCCALKHKKTPFRLLSSAKRTSLSSA
jgi:hypothetical protein